MLRKIDEVNSWLRFSFACLALSDAFHTDLGHWKPALLRPVYWSQESLNYRSCVLGDILYSIHLRRHSLLPLTDWQNYFFLWVNYMGLYGNNLLRSPAKVPMSSSHGVTPSKDLSHNPLPGLLIFDCIPCVFYLSVSAYLKPVFYSFIA